MYHPKGDKMKRKPAPPKAPAPRPVVEPAFPSLRLSHPLQAVFDDALAQATRGKGNARHGQGKDPTDAENFLAQDWREIARRHGPGFLSGQAEKKLREALELAHAERDTELLGVLVYVAMLVIHHRRSGR
jgi:hypothetical protein